MVKGVLTFFDSARQSLGCKMRPVVPHCSKMTQVGLGSALDAGGEQRRQFLDTTLVVAVEP
jgi:hypothetical protein